ncbi:RNA polymerase sigma factor [mine drainage metagenome]|uniref:RNA polymerase sigma factor n=1 Tax=mine drainage metagenome TaxID=410659 RepID=A0A1J5SIA0_9ZZZZ
MEGTGPSPEPAAREPAALVEHFFRHETGRLHGALVRLMGVQNLAVAEDVAQEAMLRALRAWAMGGVPANPSGWITRVAMNLARDTMRHRRMAFGKEPALITHFEQHLATPAVAWEGAREFRDDTLRLMFVCCHPSVARDAQVVLALKILCGFSAGEIARAFLASEAAIEKQLARTKQRIAESGIGFELPEGEDLAPRLDGVLATLYLLFNEGHTASSGDRLLREDLCGEAMRLADLLVAHPAGRSPRSHALLALLCLTAARFPARVDERGGLTTLADQDRSKWDRALFERGLVHLAEAAAGSDLSEYHLEAGIAACHALAADYASTDWARILQLYDELIRLKPSPVVGLNRVVALARARGAQTGLEALEDLQGRERLDDSHLYHAVRGQLLLEAGRPAESAESFRLAHRLARVDPEREHLARRLETASLAGESAEPLVPELSPGRRSSRRA